MQECSKCGEPKPDGEFLTKLGARSRRCNACRGPCPDCERLRQGKSRKKVTVRCERCREAARPPGWPKERFPIKRHAIARFHDRVRPDLSSYRECVYEMLVMMETAPWSDDPPSWYPARRYEGTLPFRRGYLTPVEGVLFALSAYGVKGVQVATVMVSDDFVPPEAGPRPQWVEDIYAADRRRDVENAAKRARRAERRLALYPPDPEREVGQDAESERS